MSASEVTITLTCENAAAELLLVNSDFELIAHGPPPLSARVEPGIYALKAKIGADVSERLEVLTPRAETYYFNLAAPEFESPMPLVQTSTNREYQQNSVAQFTGDEAVPLVLGKDSALMLYVRDTSHRNFDLPQEQQERYAGNFRGLRLLTTTGVELVNFDTQSTATVAFGYLGAQVHLNAGAYVLALTDGDQQTCLAVNLVCGWMLQIYLRLQPVSRDSIEMRPDLCDAAFAYDRAGASYSAHREDFRAMEAVRLALLDRRNVVNGQMMRELLDGKYENPMLGVYAGHLMLADGNRDASVCEKVIASTAALLGPGYPDLLSLAWSYEAQTGQRPKGYDARPWVELLAEVKGPPLLTLSWDLLVQRALSSGLTIESFPAFSAAGNLAVSGSVLTWKRSTRTTPPQRETFDATQAPPASTAQAPGSLFRHLGKVLWNGLLKPLITRLPDGSSAPVPKLEVKDLTIDTPAAAARAMRQIANKAPWQDLVRYVHTHPGQLDDLHSFSALQRDLLLTLARASTEPAVLEAINEDYLSGVMRAHRIPLTTVASALRSLDFLAVSTEIVRRVRAALNANKSTLAKHASRAPPDAANAG